MKAHLDGIIMLSATECCSCNSRRLYRGERTRVTSGDVNVR